MVSAHLKDGHHVKYVIDQITTKLAEHIVKEDKDLTVEPSQIKNNIWMFINCSIERTLVLTHKQKNA